jgi:2'-5' RNA ligase
VIRSTAAVGRPPEDRPFHGHLTLARVKSGGTRGLVGASISGRWPVSEVCLVESRLHPHGARYETVAAFPLRAVGDEKDRP